MAIKAGTSGDFADSMAAAIERALQLEWPRVVGDGSSVDSNPQLKLLCVAVAQGVVGYLAAHAADIVVTAESDGTHTHTLNVRLETAGELL